MAVDAWNIRTAQAVSLIGAFLALKGSDGVVSNVVVLCICIASVAVALLTMATPDVACVITNCAILGVAALLASVSAMHLYEMEEAGKTAASVDTIKDWALAAH